MIVAALSSVLWLGCGRSGQSGQSGQPCGGACAAGEQCVGGICRLACPAGQADCLGACVNTRIDPNNCGTCGVTCKPGELCRAGKCTLICPAGTSKCDGTCADLSSDASHCGACGNGCAPAESCSGGVCVGGWAVSVGSVTGYEDITSRSMIADSGGNIYVTGTFSGALILGTLKVPSRDYAIFVAKLDSGLNPVWAASTADNNRDTYVEDIIPDGKGGAYITGCFLGPQITFGAHTVKRASSASSYGTQLFVAKVDSKGKWAWARSAVSDSGVCGYAVAADSIGDAYITGNFAGSKVTFGTLTLSSKVGGDIFVAKLDRNGTWRWASGATNPGAYYYGFSSADIVVDGAGDTYITGSFDSTITFGSLTLASKGGGDIFVAKLDKKGAWSWAASGGGKGKDLGDRLAAHSSGNIFITGTVSSGKSTFGTLTLSTKGSPNVFVASIHKDGAWQWVRGGPDAGHDRAPAVATDSSGDAYVAGSFSLHKSTFGPFTLASKGGDDVFVAKLNKKGAWSWARGAGSPVDDSACGVATDSSGNVYTAGHLGGSSTGPHKATFGQHTLTGSSAQDMYVARQSSTGAFTKARRFSAVASGKDYGLGMARDSAGSIYVTGRFVSKATFGTLTLTAKGSEEVFVAKADRKGRWLWAVAGDTSRAFGYGVAVDSHGDAYVTGFFEGDGSSSGGYKAAFGAHTVTAPSNNNREVFVAKINKAGKWVWAAAGGGAFHDDGHDVEVDGAGNLFVTGCVAGAAKFGTTTLAGKGSSDLFVAKVDAGSGKWLWARSGGSPGTDCGHDLAVDGAGAAYITGRIGDSATFGAKALITNGGDDVLVAKINKDGAWQWVTGGGGSAFDCGYGMDLDSAGDMAVTGTFHGAARFGAITLTAKGTNDVFVGKLNSAGSWSWVARGGGTSFAYGKGVAMDRLGNIHVAGYSYGAASFGIFTLAGGGSTTPFVARLSSAGAWTAARAPTSTASLGAAHAIVAGPGGNTITTGGFSAAADFAGTNLQSLGKSDIFVWHLPLRMLIWTGQNMSLRNRSLNFPIVLELGTVSRKTDQIIVALQPVNLLIDKAVELGCAIHFAGDVGASDVNFTGAQAGFKEHRAATYRAKTTSGLF